MWACIHRNDVKTITNDQWTGNSGRFVLQTPLTHEACGVGDVGADLAVNLDESLHADFLDLISSQSVLQPVPQEDDEGEALPQFVGASGGPRSLWPKHRG